jgi:hypothetical protein
MGRYGGGGTTGNQSHFLNCPIMSKVSDLELFEGFMVKSVN